MDVDILLFNINRSIQLLPDEIDFLIPLLQSKSLEAGEYLLREGDVCRHVSFITHGCLKTYYINENGNEHIVDFLIEEWWADDLYSFFTATASKSTIKAIEATEVLQISKINLELLYQNVPKFERFFRILFQNAYISQKEQINSMLSSTAEERYKLFIQKKPYANKRFSQKDIASYLGITPPFLSSLKKKLRQLNVD
ncbi:MAG: Crp/Fnr family transcriptional regulator [Chitinophagaceae bacterium]|nr:Crp/Fnr family transcriptional regulator [Chitinophagaceae bacterium]